MIWIILIIVFIYIFCGVITAICIERIDDRNLEENLIIVIPMWPFVLLVYIIYGIYILTNKLIDKIF